MERSSSKHPDKLIRHNMAGFASPRGISRYRILSEIFQHGERMDTDPHLHMPLMSGRLFDLIPCMRRHAKLPFAAVKLVDRAMKQEAIILNVL